MKRITLLLTSVIACCFMATAQQETRYDQEIKITPQLSMVKQHDLWGLVDDKGKVLVPLKHRMIFRQSNELIAFRDGLHGKWSFYDTFGNFLQTLPYKEIGNVNGKYFRYQIGRTWGLMDVKFQVIKAALYEEIRVYQDSFLKVKQNGRYGLWDLEGKELLPCRYGGFGWIYLDVVMIKENLEWGLIKWDGTVLFEPQFEYMGSCGSGRARIKRQGKFGIISIQGEIIVPFKYDFVQDFKHGFLEVELNGKKTLVNESGEELTALIYDGIFYRRFTEKLIDIQIDRKWGLLDLQGNDVVEPMYASIGRFEAERAVVSLTEGDKYKVGLITPQGEFIIPIRYHRIERIRYLVHYEGPIRRETGYMCWDEEGATLYDPQGKCLSCP